MKRRQCKQVLERTFKVPFRRSSINNLSIDFYNSSLMIGLQYNSKHHYEYSPKFHKKSYTKFRDIQREDLLRKQMCKEAGIKLISIPYNTPCIPGRIGRILGSPLLCLCGDCTYTRMVVDESWRKKFNV